MHKSYGFNNSEMMEMKPIVFVDSSKERFHKYCSHTHLDHFLICPTQLPSPRALQWDKLQSTNSMGQLLTLPCFASLYRCYILQYAYYHRVCSTAKRKHVNRLLRRREKINNPTEYILQYLCLDCETSAMGILPKEDAACNQKLQFSDLVETN
uniref:Uncharacterized protein n=1 Tax=Arundo donax TaxID=35708 RepID=A0A0A9FPH3_ARUDO